MTVVRSSIAAIALGAGLMGLTGDAATTSMLPRGAQPAVWTEVKWPFPLDEWGLGRAYLCGAADCGSEIKLYLRAKIGFCNCTTGVSDDAELDRVGDLEILSQDWVGIADGREIKVGTLKGRSRPFRLTIRYAAPFTAIAIGFNDKCDVAVATVMADRDRLAAAEDHALAFLNSKPMLSWAGEELGQP